MADAVARKGGGIVPVAGRRVVATVPATHWRADGRPGHGLRWIKDRRARPCQAGILDGVSREGSQ